MSLTTERLAIESRIAALDKERARIELRADMQIVTIRREASTFLTLEQIDVDRLEVAVGELREYRTRFDQIVAERARLAKQL